MEEKTLALGITSEEMRALYFNATQLREANYRLWQLNSRGKRYYYTFDGDEPVFFPSVTTILHNVMPENKFLTAWKLSLGKEESESYTMDRARFGSFVHSQIAELMIARTFDLNSMSERLARYTESEHLPMSFLDHEEEAKFAILSFAKWMYDYDVKPLAVEISLYHPYLGYAGMIDCVCTMRRYPKDDKKNGGNEERVAAIVDFKTTNKEFRDEHAIQLGLYKDMWNENFPDTPITEIANVSPKAWWNTVKKNVSYQFEWQTENEVLKQIPYLLELYKLLPTESKKIPICSGIINLDEDVDSKVSVISLEELIKTRHEEETNIPEDMR